METYSLTSKTPAPNRPSLDLRRGEQSVHRDGQINVWLAERSLERVYAGFSPLDCKEERTNTSFRKQQQRKNRTKGKLIPLKTRKHKNKNRIKKRWRKLEKNRINWKAGCGVSCRLAWQRRYKTACKTIKTEPKKVKKKTLRNQRKINSLIQTPNKKNKK